MRALSGELVVALAGCALGSRDSAVRLVLLGSCFVAPCSALLFGLHILELGLSSGEGRGL